MIKKISLLIFFPLYFICVAGLMRISQNWQVLYGFSVSLGISFILTAFLILLYVILQKKINRLEGESSKDGLTGIFNQKYFREILNHEVIRAKRYGRSLSLIVFDIDDFKNINTSYGHQTGDQIIKMIAKLIQGQIRGMDVLGRWGGEEFFLLLPETNIKHGFFVAERIRYIVEVYKVDRQYNVTTSIGLAEMRKDDTSESLIERADKAVYRAKSAGKNRVELAT